MSKIFPKAVSVIVVASFLVPLVGFAQTPGLPHQFFGTVKFTDGVAVPNGRTVEAKINGSVVGSSVTSNGNYGYNPNFLFALDNDGVNAGETVEFYVSGVKANETAVFANGNSSQRNLTIPAPTTPTPPLSAAAQKVDANKDGKIDVLDFNTLMVNWGSTNANEVFVGDFNGDGKVNVFDFNLLMINWTL